MTENRRNPEIINRWYEHIQTILPSTHPGVFFSGTTERSSLIDSPSAITCQNTDERLAMEGFGIRPSKIDTNIRISEPFLIKTGAQLILSTHELPKENSTLPVMLENEDYALIMNNARNVYGLMPNGTFAALTTAAISTMDLGSEIIVDFGSGALNQAAVALKRSSGESFAYCIEEPAADPDEDFIKAYSQGILMEEARAIIENNGPKVNHSNLQFARHDINELTSDEIRQNVTNRFGKEPTMAIANIGPSYGETDLSAMKIIKETSSIKKVVLGGYVLGSEHMDPQKALETLGEEFEIIETFSTEGGFCSIVLERK